MNEPNIAVKSFIVDDGKLLIIKRRDDDVHTPGVWEIPGGRLESGESPFLGLIREVKEETGLDIEVKNPLDVDHFTRDDGQVITMIIFLCKALTYTVKLSEEHTDYEWVPVNKVKEKLIHFFHKTVDNYMDYM